MRALPNFDRNPNFGLPTGSFHVFEPERLCSQAATVSAQKAVLDQQEGIIANALGRILPASLFIRGNPQNQLDRLCRNQFQSLSSAEDFQIPTAIGKMLPILIVSV